MPAACCGHGSGGGPVVVGEDALPLDPDLLPLDEDMLEVGAGADDPTLRRRSWRMQAAS